MRIKYVTFVAVFLALTVPLTAQRVTTYQRLVVPNSVVAIAPATLAGMAICTARLEGGAIRWRMDGTDPTAAIGMPLEADDVLPFPNIFDAQTARFIRSGGSNGTLNISCFPQ